MNKNTRRRRNPSDEDELHIPLLRSIAASRGLVVLGGQIKADKLQFLQKQVGKKNVEWIGTEGTGSIRSIDALAMRVRHGGVGAVIFLDGLIGHRHFKPVLDVARPAGVPVGYGGKAGKSSLAQAMLEIETSLQHSGMRRNPRRPPRLYFVVRIVRGREKILSTHRTLTAASASARRLRAAKTG